MSDSSGGTDGVPGGGDGSGDGPGGGDAPHGGDASTASAVGARLRGIFLGSKLRIFGTIVLALLLLVVLGFVLGVFGVPSVEGVDNRFGGVNESTTVIETDLRVHNPNPIGLKLGGSTLEYSVAMNDIRMAEGTYEGLGVGPGNSTLNFTSYMDNGKIPSWWASHVRNGEHTTVEVVATVRSSLLPFSVAPPKIERPVDTDITAAFNSTKTRPINASRPLVSDPVLYLNETSGTWGEVTGEETEILLEFTLYNPKPYAISASRIGYDMSMNGIAVGEGETGGGVVIPPGETREIEATTTIVNGRLDEWWVSHLERNQRTTLAIDFEAQIGSSDGTFEPIRIPLDTMETTFETDIFGTKAETDAGGTGTATDDGSDGDGTTDDGATDDNETGTDTPTATDGTATDDGGLLGGTDDGPSDTDESTPTPTPTETDDGGLLG